MTTTPTTNANNAANNAAWQAANDRYLAASLNWLRAKLMLLAPDESLSLEAIAKNDAKQNAVAKSIW